MPEIIDPVFAKTSPKRSFCMTENERFGLVFVKTGSINSDGGGGSIVRKTADTALYSVLNICKYFVHIYLLGWSSDHQSLL